MKENEIVQPGIAKMSYRKFRAWLLRKKGISLGYAYPGNQSSNWDGSWWMVEFSGGEEQDKIGCQHVEITALKRFDGLAYCRQKATEKAFAQAARQFGIEVEG